jgi:hypothetical protein
MNKLSEKKKEKDEFFDKRCPSCTCRMFSYQTTTTIFRFLCLNCFLLWEFTDKGTFFYQFSDTKLGDEIIANQDQEAIMTTLNHLKMTFNIVSAETNCSTEKSNITYHFLVGTAILLQTIIQQAEERLQMIGGTLK